MTAYSVCAQAKGIRHTNKVEMNGGVSATDKSESKSTYSIEKGLRYRSSAARVPVQLHDQQPHSESHRPPLDFYWRAEPHKGLLD
jgi:hypothetical protein